ncbi:MAG: BlaI/MecI/CopY family transcriptional regulator [Pirellula sp.]
MARPQTGRPTDQELDILNVIWALGPSSVRAVWQELSQSREIGQTSVLKTMQIMRDKGLLVCDADQRPQVFRTAQSQKATLKQLAGDLMGRVFGGSTSLLLLHAMESKKTSRAELAEIRALLDQFDKGK